jgi:hypothetical protein
MNTACDREGCDHTGTRPIEALGGEHDWDWVDTTAATYLVTGEQTYQCIKCGGNSGATRSVSAGLSFTFVPDTNNQEYMVSRGTAEGAIVIPATFNDLPVTEIASNGFFPSDEITSVFIPASLRVIGNQAFMASTNLISVDFAQNSNLATIGGDAFAGTGLTGIVIPKSVRVIGGQAFGGSASLANVNFEEGILLESIEQRAFFNTKLWDDAADGSIVYIGNWLIGGKGTVSGGITINDGTVGIADYALANASALTSVTIPQSLRFIGSSAFDDSINIINEIHLPEGVIVRSNAFRWWEARQTIRIPFVTLDEAITVGAWHSQWRNNCNAVIINSNGVQIFPEQ